MRSISRLYARAVLELGFDVLAQEAIGKSADGRG